MRRFLSLTVVAALSFFAIVSCTDKNCQEENMKLKVQIDSLEHVSNLYLDSAELLHNTLKGIEAYAEQNLLEAEQQKQ